MRVLSIVHERSAGSGVFAEAAREHDAELLEWMPASDGPAPRGPFDAALVFGGAAHVDQDERHAWLRGEKALLRELMLARTPALGVCLGAQLLAELGGARVARMPAPEIGWTRVRLEPHASADPVLGELPREFEAFQWHSYGVSLPRQAVAMASSASCLQAYRLACAPCWGIQFHAEVTGETIAGWIEDYRSDPDALDAKLDWRALAAESGREIRRWNELGREICGRFLAVAERSGRSRAVAQRLP